MKRINCGVFLVLIGFAGGIVFMIYHCGYILENKQKKVDKYFSYFKFFDQWLSCKEQNYDFADYFNKHGIKSVAIYGMGRLGKHLKYELEKSGIKVDYVIDEGEKIIYGEETHYNLRDSLPLVDAVVVTPIDEFEEIKEKILENNKMLRVVSVDKVIG